MRVLVTGATGYLGQYVVRELHRVGASVTAHGKTRVLEGETSIVGDLANDAVAANVLGSSSWDAVVHLAGPVTSGNESLDQGLGVVSEHTRMALALRRYAPAARIVHASSMTVYGTPSQTDVTEEHPRDPRHLYGLAKMLSEEVLLSAPELDAWILRLPGLFSAERRNGALYHFCRAARVGDPIRVSATAPTAWNILHVADAADALVRAVMAPIRSPGALNIAYRESVELVAVASEVAELSGNKSRVEASEDIQHRPLRLVIDKAARLISWAPPSLHQRLAELYAAYAA